MVSPSITTDELRSIAGMERWKAEHGTDGAKAGFIARAEVIEQLIAEIDSECDHRHGKDD